MLREINLIVSLFSLKFKKRFRKDILFWFEFLSFNEMKIISDQS